MPPWGHVYHLNNSESPTPNDVFWIRWNSYFLGPLLEPITPPPPPPPPPGPLGATLGTAMNTFNYSHKKVFEYYITWLFYFWIWRRVTLKFAWFWPLGALSLGPHGGHVYHMNSVESSALKDDSCQVWLKSDLEAFSRSKWNSYFLHRPPPPPQGPIGATLGTATNNLYSSPKKVYTHYITWLFYLNWIWRRSLKFAKFWPLGAPSPWTPMGATCTKWTTLTPRLLRMIPAKFG